MKLFSLLSLVTLLSLSASAASVTTSVTVKPNPANLNDLPHDSAVLWGFDLSALTLDSHYRLSSATITISDLNDWTIENGDNLFIDLVDNPLSGVTSYADKDNGASDYFTQANGGYSSVVKNPSVTKLTVFQDTNEVKGKYNWFTKKYNYTNPSETFVYNFTDIQLDALALYLDPLKSPAPAPLATVTKKGKHKVTTYQPYSTVGLSFDADCHYYNTGVTFTVTSEYVPETSTTLALFGLSVLGLAGLRRFFRRA